MSRLILASGSPSRRAILERAGVPFQAMRPAVDEEALKPLYRQNTPAELALALATAKASSIREPRALIMGADQVMEFGGEAYDKPKDRDELRERLAAMSGRAHYLRGAVVLMKDQTVIETIEETSVLTMRSLSLAEIDGYLAAISDDVLATVGGYALEGLGGRLFDKVKGDFFAILGLPLYPVLAVLRREGLLPW